MEGVDQAQKPFWNFLSKGAFTTGLGALTATAVKLWVNRRFILNRT